MTSAAQLAQYAAPGSSLGFKNRIINGDMRIDQRNAGASVSVTDANQYTLDRWQGVASIAASKFTIQQSSNAPSGFSTSLLVTATSSYSVLSNDYFMIRQKIEGFNTSDLNWGTSNALTVTLSFWVKSSVTGSFGAAVVNSANSFSFPFSYTVLSSNTWEYKSITISGPTSGSWVGATNGIGLQIKFSLGSGASYSGASNTWSSSDLVQPTGSASIVAASGATFYITGVQLEKGSVATPFEYRDYGRELIMCQRYFERCIRYVSGVAGSSNTNYGTMVLKVVKRATPTVTYSAGYSTVTNAQPESVQFTRVGEPVDFYDLTISAEL